MRPTTPCPSLADVDLGDGVHLRLAHEDEYRRLGDALVSAFSSSMTVTDGYEKRLRDITGHSRDSHIWVLVDSSGDVHGGYITPKPDMLDSAHFEFHILGVAPSARGHGYGRQMVFHAFRLAAYYGYEGVEIHSEPKMTFAHRLYYSCGFKRRPDWETKVVDGGERLLFFYYAIKPHAPTDRKDRKEAAMPSADSNLESLLGHDAICPKPYGSVPRPFPNGKAPEPLVLEVADGNAMATALARLAERLDDPGLSIRSERPNSPIATLRTMKGILLTDDWRTMGRTLSMVDAADTLYPSSVEGLRASIDLEDSRIVYDIVGNIPDAVTNGLENPVEMRIMYARLGWFEHTLATHDSVLPYGVTETDYMLAGAFRLFDRVSPLLPRIVAHAEDYPNLSAHARRLLD